MKNIYKYLSLVLFFTGFVPTNSKAEDYSKMSAAELNAAFVSAVKKHNPEKMEELIAVGADVTTPISYTWTAGDCDWSIETSALTYAVRNNCSQMIKVLLKVKSKLNESLNEALAEAITEGYCEVVKELINGGAAIENLNKDKDTPLILAVKHARPMGEFSPQAQRRAASRWKQRREIIQLLLKAGADVNHVNAYGRTALMEAVIQHDLNTVLDLLKIPAMTAGSFFGFGTKAINYADQDGNTALIHAVKNIRTMYIAGDMQEYHTCKNSQSIAETLFKTPGVDLHYANNKGETAITLFQKLNKQ